MAILKNCHLFPLLSLFTPQKIANIAVLYQNLILSKKLSCLLRLHSLFLMFKTRRLTIHLFYSCRIMKRNGLYEV